MLRRIGVVIVVVGLLSLWISPAQARTTPLPLYGSSLRLTPPSPGRVLQCSDEQCGFVALDVVLTGLDGRASSTPAGVSHTLDLGGTVRVTRLFGCRRTDGKRLHRYDAKVRDQVGLGTVDGQPASFPEQGDTVELEAYGFFPAAEPKACPADAQAMLYEVEVDRARPRLVSHWDAVASKTYRLPDQAGWTGAVPVAAPVPPEPSTADPGTGPLPLYGSTTALSTPGTGLPLDCRDRLCGYVAVDLVLTGLDGRARPTTPHDLSHTLDVGGTVEVTRTFGCQRNGRQLHRYDQKVHDEVGLGTPRGGPYFVPETGDTFEFTVYGFFFDPELKACPAGTQAALFGIRTKKARPAVVSHWDPIPSQTYAVPDRIAWNGAVPVLAPAS